MNADTITAHPAAHTRRAAVRAGRGTAEAATARATPSDRLAAAARIAFGLAWAADAALKWQPAFAHATLLDALRSAVDGQPPAVAAWIRLWAHVVAADPAAWALLLAAAETLLAAALITGTLTNLACAAGAALSLMIWTTAEGLGGPYTPNSMDIGASIAYAIAFALVAASHAARPGASTPASTPASDRSATSPAHRDDSRTVRPASPPVAAGRAAVRHPEPGCARIRARAPHDDGLTRTPGRARSASGLPEYHPRVSAMTPKAPTARPMPR